MRKMIRAVWFTFGLAIAVGAAGATDGDVPDFRVGDWCRYDMTVTIAFSGMTPFTNTGRMSFEMTARDEETITTRLLTERRMQDGKVLRSVNVNEHPLKNLRDAWTEWPNVPRPPPDVWSASEPRTLEVAGVPFECKYVEIRNDNSSDVAPGIESVLRIWSSPAVAGGFIRMEQTARGSQIAQDTVTMLAAWGDAENPDPDPIPVDPTDADE